MQSPVGVERTEHYRWLDCLRFAAALLVVLQHARGVVFAPYGELDPAMRTPSIFAFYSATRLGQEAVVVFFALSGYLVGGPSLARMRAGTFNPRSYALDRITRIWMPLVPALVLTAWIHPGAETVGVWLANLFGLQGVLAPELGGNGPLWSLAYEIWFYVLAFAAGRVVVRRKVDAVALLLFAAVVLVFTRLQAHYLVCWAIGAVFYVRPHALPPWAGLGLGGALMAVAVAGLVITGSGYMATTIPARGVPELLHMLLSSGAAITFVSLTRCRAGRVCAMVAPLAAFSYTLFLTHYPLLTLLEHAGWERRTTVDAIGLSVFAGSIAGCMLAAWLLYLAFERHTARVRHWLKSWSFGGRVAAG